MSEVKKSRTKKIVVIAIVAVALVANGGFLTGLIVRINDLDAIIVAQNSTIQAKMNQIASLTQSLNNLNARLAQDNITIQRLLSQHKVDLNTIGNLSSKVAADENIIHLNVSTTLGTYTFQIYANPSGLGCNYNALFTFTATNAGYLKISGFSSSPYTIVDVDYNTDITSASSWFVASFLQSSINAIVPIYPSTIIIYVQNCDTVPIYGSITVVEYT